jgi:hypothetical protein
MQHMQNHAQLALAAQIVRITSKIAVKIVAKIVQIAKTVGNAVIMKKSV